jgi:hypothetical protein
MPGMPRLNAKSTKIAYAIMGVPQNMKKSRKKKNDKLNQRLIAEETIRVR